MTLNRKWWWLAAAGAPFLSACGPSPTPTCGLLGGGGSLGFAPWDGGVVDGGSVTSSGLDRATCATVCAAPANQCLVADAGLVECRLFCIGGRVPAGLQTLSAVDGTAGSWLARMAELEAAAVHAFINLAQELDTHGLPQFADAAMKAAGHEMVHAQRTAGLALRFGHVPRWAEVTTTSVRSLEALAVDNAGEGCGRELFGAVMNEHQGRTAADLEVARVMGDIAADERQHAELSFALSQALMPRLPLAQRRRAREAQAMVLETLGADDAPPATRVTLGLMDPQQALETSRRLLATRRV